MSAAAFSGRDLARGFKRANASMVKARDAFALVPDTMRELGYLS